MPEPKGSSAETESRRILDRVAREADSSGFATGTARGPQPATVAPDSDPIEVWGTRIGRTLGLVIGIGLTVWLVVFILRGG